MEHNRGRAFSKCATKSCDYWIWAASHSDESQARFDDHMDALNDDWEDC